MHGPTRIFWAKLAPFSLQARLAALGYGVEAGGQAMLALEIAVRPSCRRLLGPLFTTTKGYSPPFYHTFPART
jgi:hypothetical protein